MRPTENYCFGVTCGDTGTPHFSVLCFVALHSCCVFLHFEGKPLGQKKDYGSLYCNTDFTMVVCTTIESNAQYLQPMPTERSAGIKPKTMLQEHFVRV